MQAISYSRTITWVLSCILINWLLLCFVNYQTYAEAGETGAMHYNFSAQYTKEKPLIVLVPLKRGFNEFVSGSNASSLDGFSIRVFKASIASLQYPPVYEFHILKGSSENSTPSYDHMVDMVEKGKADAIAADITITLDRMSKVDFTIPYIASSLVMVTPYSNGVKSTYLDFLKPFSWQLWTTLLCTLMATGAVLYLLESKNPDFSVSPKLLKKPANTNTDEPNSVHQQTNTPSANIVNSTNNYLHHHHPQGATRLTRLLNAYWFTSLCAVFAQQEAVRTHLGRIVTVAWLFVMLIFNASYTASLASLLTAQGSYPKIQSFEGLLKSNVTVGYQAGSFLRYTLQTLGFPLKRLESYSSIEEYEQAIRDETIVAILDEQPYAQLLLNKECNLMAVDDQVTYFGGLGFVFKKNSTLTKAISEGILQLAENGTLQKIKHETLETESGHCNSSSQQSNLGLTSFVGLFTIMAILYSSCILWRIGKSFISNYQHSSTTTTNGNNRQPNGSNTQRLRSFMRHPSIKVNPINTNMGDIELH